MSSTEAAETKTATQNWKQQIAAFKKLKSSANEIPLESTDTSYREIYYILETEENLGREDLKIRLLQREKLSSGKIGQLKKFDISYRKRFDHLLCTQSDKDIFSMFKNFLGGDKYYSSSLEHMIFPLSMVSFVLKELSQTGRLLVCSHLSTLDKRTPLLSQWMDEPLSFLCEVLSEENHWEINGHFSLPTDEESETEDSFSALLPEQKLLCTGNKIYPLEVHAELKAYFDFQRTQGPLQVPKDQRDSFLNFIKEFFPYNLLSLPEDLPISHQEVQGNLFLEVDFQGGQVVSQALFSYNGGKCLPLSSERPSQEETPSDVFLSKDFSHEKEELKKLLSIPNIQTLNSKKFTYTIPADSFVATIEELEAQGVSIQVRDQQVVRPTDFSTRISSGIDWFEINGEVSFDNIKLSIPQILLAVKENRQFISLGDGQVGLLPKEWLDKCLQLSELSSQQNADTLQFDRSQAFLIDQMLDENQKKSDRSFKELINKLKNHSSLKTVNPTRNFSGELRTYQTTGLSWMSFLQDISLGGCLADDMGLGKTIQVLALLQKRKSKKQRPSQTSCIVVPKSLVTNWQKEAEKFTPNIKVLIYEGLQRKEILSQFTNYDLVVFTYGVLRRDISEISQFHFDYAILDEAQAIKNENSQTAKASYLLQASHKLALTGTPVENHLGELFSIFRFLIPGLFYKKIQSYKNLQQDDEAAQSLLKGLRPFILRRTKEKVLTELPEKTETILWCELEEQQKEEYERVKNYYKTQLNQKIETDGLQKSKIQVLEALMRLRQVACHPGLVDPNKKSFSSGKVSSLIEQLQTIQQEGKKALVFSQFTSMLSLVKERLEENGMPYVYLDGKTQKRESVIEQFKNDDSVPFFLISLKAGGVGLNLTEASYCFLLDPWWNPAVENQAIDRAHRIGQKNKVMAYKLISKGTVEEKILELQSKKKQLYDDVLHASDGFLKKMSMDDLTYIFS